MVIIIITFIFQGASDTESVDEGFCPSMTVHTREPVANDNKDEVKNDAAIDLLSRKISDVKISQTEIKEVSDNFDIQ